MTISRLSAITSKLISNLPIGLLPSILLLVFVALPTVSYAQQGAAPGEEVYFGRLGCWNCHGKDGEGGKGIPGGPVLVKSQLPLRRFIGSVRLPINMMPPFAPGLAPDAELMTVYHWLNGIDSVRTPAAITIDLKSSPQVRAGEQASTQVEIEMTAIKAETVPTSDAPDLASLRFRVTLITNEKGPVANQTLEYRPASLQQWSKFTTDENGEALLGPDRNFIVAGVREKQKARLQLRMAPPAVQTVVVIEALDSTQPAKLIVVGIGSAIFKGVPTIRRDLNAAPANPPN